MDSDQDGEHIKTVYAHFGLALFLAQVLEHGLVNALVLVELLPTRAGNPVPHKQWEATYDSFCEQNFKATLGKMIRNLKEAVVIPANLERILDEALRKRNFLAHDYFRERDVAFLSKEGREKMIDELQDAQALFKAADTNVEEVTKTARDRYGITEEYINKMLKERLLKNNINLY